MVGNRQRAGTRRGCVFDADPDAGPPRSARDHVALGGSSAVVVRVVEQGGGATTHPCARLAAWRAPDPRTVVAPVRRRLARDHTVGTRVMVVRGR